MGQIDLYKKYSHSIELSVKKTFRSNEKCKYECTMNIVRQVRSFRSNEKCKYECTMNIVRQVRSFRSNEKCKYECTMNIVRQLKSINQSAVLEEGRRKLSETWEI